MVRRRTLFFLSFIVLVAAIARKHGNWPSRTSQCRTIPGDTSWPDSKAFDDFNKTVNGRLISTVPIASVCHQPDFDQAQCDALRNVWFFPETHLESSSSPMAYPFSNNSCNPFVGSDTACTLGGHVVYSVNATSVEHVQATIKFARKNNIRLVVRNTGHDYLGRSTGAYAIAIWTRHLKSLELISEYHGTSYDGPAIRVGAGIESQEAYAFAEQNGLMVVGGNCPTVALAGGYSQGGGHGPLSSRHGLAADQILEIEAVTANGRLVKATPTSNADLLWALSGGGGGTYAVVVSMTVKAFTNTHITMATFSLMNNGTNADAIYEVLGTFLQNLPALADAGAFVAWVAAPFGLLMSPAMGPGIHKEELDLLIKPTLDKMSDLKQEFSYSSTEYSSFLPGYDSLTSTWNVSDYNVAGRLIPRSLVEEDTPALVEVIRYISEQTISTGVTFNVNQSGPYNVSANPYWRKSLFGMVVGTPINYTDYSKTIAGQDLITNDLLPRIAEITPNGGAYLNEADFQQPDFQTLFFGENYKRLLAIKRRYDQDDLFWARTAVGSERWSEQSDGRLCRV
ncbi:FAD-binding domain-containing protein [Pseudovirgaria hyperparasitica]|uniref:FAD-binding domain-containing protein n=1 Tax=Pseudovirgaria hyperparasitica TaxID=470096 RepID=A0A6A6WDJ3_9PEZI|nr:FAD-binding domain-containing protein [Pseudovirgaria hyperparasitica]KAF2759926.1 FAD-binding domain-containing protein [Pseudovirgaria hyperparasitica]